MKRLIGLTFLLFSSPILAGTIESGDYQPFGVIADDYSMNDKPAFSFSFGKSKNSHSRHNVPFLTKRVVKHQQRVRAFMIFRLNIIMA